MQGEERWRDMSSHTPMNTLTLYKHIGVLYIKIRYVIRFIKIQVFINCCNSSIVPAICVYVVLENGSAKLAFNLIL